MATTPARIADRGRREPHAAARGSTSRPAIVRQQQIVLHGQHVTFLESGADTGGPVVVLLHGLASSSQTWASVMPLLGRHAHVIAPDLLGHGHSAKPPSGDYSLGAYAAGLRDLLVALGVCRATVVGHSFGGGVAMQFVYQFPEFTERVALVASGGLGHDVSFALRAATLPGAQLALRIASTFTPRWLTNLGGRLARALPSLSPADIDGLVDAFGSFHERGARSSFTHTVRGALNWSGQRLNGTERLYLLADVPVLFASGDRDTVIPIAHTLAAYDVLPTSKLEIFGGAGHFPHVEQPQRFAHLLHDFLNNSAPARIDARSMRRRLLRDSSVLTASRTVPEDSRR
jgi:pimeloyl-ACP methyl ester carboxylesterase